MRWLRPIDNGDVTGPNAVATLQHPACQMQKHNFHKSYMLHRGNGRYCYFGGANVIRLDVYHH